MRTSDYPALHYKIVSHPGEFDLESLYGAFYRSPLTDTHHAVPEPKYAKEFRTIIQNMVKHAFCR